MFNSSMMCPTVPVVAMNGNDGNCNNGWANGNDWWGFIVLALLFGWGGNGNWGWGGNSGGAGYTDSTIQRGFDTSTIITKLDGITNGICNLGYDQLAQMNGINQNITQMGFGIQNAITQDTIANMQNTNSISRQLADCCCDSRAAIKDLQYNMATSDCSIKTLINQVTQQVMWGQQNGLRDLMDLINNKFCALENSQKDATIAELRAQLAACGNNSALQGLYTQLVNTLKPQAVPAYPAANPNGMGNWSANVLSTGGNNCCCYNNNGCCC